MHIFCEVIITLAYSDDGLQSLRVLVFFFAPSKQSSCQRHQAKSEQCSHTCNHDCFSCLTHLQREMYVCFSERAGARRAVFSIITQPIINSIELPIPLWNISFTFIKKKRKKHLQWTFLNQQKWTSATEAILEAYMNVLILAIKKQNKTGHHLKYILSDITFALHSSRKNNIMYFLFIWFSFLLFYNPCHLY